MQNQYKKDAISLRAIILFHYLLNNFLDSGNVLLNRIWNLNLIPVSENGFLDVEPALQSDRTCT